MKKNFAHVACLSLLPLTLALFACGDDSSAGPEPVAGIESSSAEQNLSSTTSYPSSSENVESSSATNPASSGTVESSGSQGTSSGIQTGFSSSVTPPGSSSSVKPQSSSSSVLQSSSSRPSYNGHVPLKSITATCREEVWTNDPVELEPPAAFYSVSNSFAQVDLQNVELTYACDSALQKAFWDNLNADNTVASVIGDTLFVNFDRSGQKGVEFRCGCTADVKFTFDEQYAGFGYTAFENNRPPLELQYILVNRPDLGYQKIEKADAQCVNEGPDDPMMDAALPPVAHMYVNGDSAQVVIERVMVTCASVIESVAIEMRDTTLYVTPHYDMSVPQADCICTTKVSFNIKALDLYNKATLLVYDNDFGNKMRLIVE